MGTSDIVGMVFGIVILALVVAGAGYVAWSSGRSDAVVYGSTIVVSEPKP